MAGPLFAGATVYFALRRSRFSLDARAFGLYCARRLRSPNPQRRNSARYPHCASWEWRRAEVTGPVVRDGRGQATGRSELRQSLDEAQNIRTDSGETPTVHWRIRLHIYGPQENDESQNDESFDEYSEVGATHAPIHVFRYGERVRFIAKFRVAEELPQSGAFDCRRYLADHGIGALGSAKSADLQLLPGFSRNKFALWQGRARMRR